MICRHDVVDISEVGLATVSKPMLSLLGRMGESAQHYPEMICRTTCVNFGSVGILLLRLVKPFLPKQTRDKFMPCGSVYTVEGTPGARLPKRFNGSCRCRWCRLNTDRLPLPIVIPSKSTVEKEVLCQKAGARVYWRVSRSSDYSPATASRQGADTDIDEDVSVAVRFRPADQANQELLQAPDQPNTCPWSATTPSLPVTPPTTPRKLAGEDAGHSRAEQKTVVSSPPPPSFVAPSCGVLVLSLTCEPQSWASWSGNKKVQLSVEVHYDGDGIGN
jgi:hypothetical protein